MGSGSFPPAPPPLSVFGFRLIFVNRNLEVTDVGIRGGIHALPSGAQAGEQDRKLKEWKQSPFGCCTSVEAGVKTGRGLRNFEGSRIKSCGTRLQI